MSNKTNLKVFQESKVGMNLKDHVRVIDSCRSNISPNRLQELVSKHTLTEKISNSTTEKDLMI